MKQLLVDMYWETQEELEKIKKSKLPLSERLALEAAFIKLNMIKKILNLSSVNQS